MARTINASRFARPDACAVNVCLNTTPLMPVTAERFLIENEVPYGTVIVYRGEHYGTLDISIPVKKVASASAALDALCTLLDATPRAVRTNANYHICRIQMNNA